MRWFTVEDDEGNLSMMFDESLAKQVTLKKGELLYEVRLVEPGTLEVFDDSIEQCYTKLYEAINSNQTLGMKDKEVFYVGWHVRIKGEKNSSYVVVERGSHKGLHLYILRDGDTHRGAFSWELELT